jgi:predicted SnoaL-like aldol condensation-catalyzing enzyme
MRRIHRPARLAIATAAALAAVGLGLSQAASGTSVPGGTETTAPPAGPETTAPAGPETTTPGGTETTAPAGPETTAPGGTETTTPAGPETTAPAGPETTAPGAPATAAPGDTGPRSEFPPFDGTGESTHCPTDPADLERNKANVVGYYTTAFNDHDPERAVELYGGAEYIQHNPLADNGFEAFITFVNDFAAAYPELNIEIVRVFAECDFVITHGIISGAPDVFGERGNKVVDIFRLDEDGKVVEHWDVLAPIAETSANGNPEV